MTESSTHTNTDNPLDTPTQFPIFTPNPSSTPNTNKNSTSPTAEEQEKLKKFQDWVNEQKEFKECQETSSERLEAMLIRKETSEESLLRYLRAEKFDLTRSQQRLIHSIQWRKDFFKKMLFVNPSQSEQPQGDLEFPKSLEKEFLTGKLLTSGFDREGHSLIYMRPRFQNTKDQENQLFQVIFCLEVAILMMKNTQQQKLVIVLDLSGYTLKNAPSLNFSKQMLSILANQYPERLHAFFLFNAPWLFHQFFRLISPFVDPVTKEKVHFVDGKTDLAEYFDLNVFPKDLGGRYDFVYNHDLYWKKLMAFYEENWDLKIV